MENYKELFFKYLSNELEGEELKTIVFWLNNPANAKQIEKWMNSDWETSLPDYTTDSSQLATSFETLKNKILDKNATPNHKQISIHHIIYRLAASVLIPIALGTITYFALSKTNKPETSVYNEINVPLGSKTKIALSDGTVIWLNSGSKLRYPSAFKNKTREVELTGEGFFEVKKDPHKPFIVKTGDINIKVLGTSFNVKSYPDERTIETTLVKGLVSISKTKLTSKNDQNLFLKPNQRAIFIKGNGKLLLSEPEKESISKENKTESSVTKKPPVIFSKNINTEQYTAWKDNKLIFKNENFENLCIKLERWFNVKIIIKNEELKKFHYTGTIQNETINDVIEILGLTMPINYKVSHSVIEIWDKNTNEKMKYY